MKLLFLVTTTPRFTVATPEQAPLGGTESCAAYLSRQLAANGHDVTLIANLPPGTPARVMGVRHLPADAATQAFFANEDFEAVIALTSPQNAQPLRHAAPRAFHIAWLHLLPEHADMQPLPQATPFIDCAVFVSDFHRRNTPFAGPSHVIGNAIAPAFENLFGGAAELQAAKQNRAVYASIPDRGLDVLIAAFRQARLDTVLDVYSGMNLYQRPDDGLEDIYAAVAATPRVTRRPSISQTELAGALRSAAFLTYPNTLAETWCITAMEAMAAGLKVISTDLGALPETGMGFADLVPITPGMDRVGLAAPFAAQMERSVSRFLADRQAWAEERFAQSQEVNRRYNWRARAKEWETLLGPAIAWRRGA